MWLAWYGNFLLVALLLLPISLLFRAGLGWYQNGSALMAISEGKGFSARRKSGVVLMALAFVLILVWFILLVWPDVITYGWYIASR